MDLTQLDYKSLHKRKESKIAEFIFRLATALPNRKSLKLPPGLQIMFCDFLEINAAPCLMHFINHFLEIRNDLVISCIQIYKYRRRILSH
jgi:hypothetical protein